MIDVWMYCLVVSSGLRFSRFSILISSGLGGLGVFVRGFVDWKSKRDDGRLLISSF